MLFSKKSISLPSRWCNHLNKEMKNMFDHKYSEYCMQDFFVDPWDLLEKMLEDFLPPQLRKTILNRTNDSKSIPFCRLLRKSIEDVYNKANSKKIERPATLAEECIIYGILQIFKDIYFDSVINETEQYAEVIKDGITEKELEPQNLKNKINEFLDCAINEIFEDTDFLDLWGGPLYTKITDLNVFFEPYYLEQRDLNKYPLINISKTKAFI